MDTKRPYYQPIALHQGNRLIHALVSIKSDCCLLISGNAVTQYPMFITETEAKMFCYNLPRAVRAFMDCVDLAPNGCWIWNKCKMTSGYGCIGRNGFIYAHRWAWEFFRGPIPKGQYVCHDCPGGDNPSCVNPNHLFLGTAKDNAQDAVKKGSYKDTHKNFGEVLKGESHPNHKLTEDSVREIRRLKREQGFGIKRVRKMFGISHGVAQRILNGSTWDHIK